MGRYRDRPGSISLQALPSDGVINLREWRESDIPALTDACRDSETRRWTLAPQNYTDEHGGGRSVPSTVHRDRGSRECCWPRREDPRERSW